MRGKAGTGLVMELVGREQHVITTVLDGSNKRWNSSNLYNRRMILLVKLSMGSLFVF